MVMIRRQQYSILKHNKRTTFNNVVEDSRSLYKILLYTQSLPFPCLFPMQSTYKKTCAFFAQPSLSPGVTKHASHSHAYQGLSPAVRHQVAIIAGAKITRVLEPQVFGEWELEDLGAVGVLDCGQ